MFYQLAEFTLGKGKKKQDSQRKRDGEERERKERISCTLDACFV